VKTEPKPPTVETVDELPEVDENTVGNLSAAERKDYAGKLKAAGNTAYAAKDYDKAIILYGKAILCKPDPIFYSNRAACYNAQGEFEKVIEDTTAAINMDNEYVKALNRRAHAYEATEKYSEALLDFTASCIIDSFRNEGTAQSVERMLKKVAEKKGKAILATKDKKLPSASFITNYLQSFRARPKPANMGEDSEVFDLSGLGQLKLGLRSVEKKTGDGYEQAAACFEKALELGELGEQEAFAYNMRGTFKYLRGDDPMPDLTKSIELQPSLTQSYIKRASMHLERGSYIFNIF
jgi:import receptor subunit TOM70